VIASPYIQDTWRIKPRLTLNYGIRLTYMPLPNIQPGYGSVFDPSKYSLSKAPTVNRDGTITPTPGYDPLNGLVFNSQDGVPQNFSNKHRWYWSPTVGFAWDLFGQGKTSLRAGFGVTRARTFTGTDCTYSCPNNRRSCRTSTWWIPSSRVRSALARSRRPRRRVWVGQASTIRPRACIRTA